MTNPTRPRAHPLTKSSLGPSSSLRQAVQRTTTPCPRHCEGFLTKPQHRILFSLYRTVSPSRRSAMSQSAKSSQATEPPTSTSASQNSYAPTLATDEASQRLKRLSWQSEDVQRKSIGDSSYKLDLPITPTSSDQRVESWKEDEKSNLTEERLMYSGRRSTCLTVHRCQNRHDLTCTPRMS